MGLVGVIIFSPTPTKVKHENQQLENHPQQPHRRTGKFKEPSKGSL
jgi:hypothetical protein